MTFPEAKESMKRGALVATNNVDLKRNFCLFLTGHLLRMVKVKGKKEKGFLFRGNCYREEKIIRFASQFYLPA